MDEVKLQLRLDPELHEQLVAAARAGSRSLNAELRHRLQQSFEEGAASPELQRELEQVKQLAQERASTIQGLQVTRDLLASFLCDVENLLPEDKRGGPGVQSLMRFARSVIGRDVDALRDAFAEMTPGKTEQLPYAAMLTAMTQSLTVPPLDPSAPPAPAPAAAKAPRKG